MLVRESIVRSHHVRRRGDDQRTLHDLQAFRSRAYDDEHGLPSSSPAPDSHTTPSPIHRTSSTARTRTASSGPARTGATATKRSSTRFTLQRSASARTRATAARWTTPPWSSPRRSSPRTPTNCCGGQLARGATSSHRSQTSTSLRRNVTAMASRRVCRLRCSLGATLQGIAISISRRRASSRHQVATTLTSISTSRSNDAGSNRSQGAVDGSSASLRNGGGEAIASCERKSNVHTCFCQGCKSRARVSVKGLPTSH